MNKEWTDNAPATIRKAFETAPKIKESCICGARSLNLSSIATEVIQNVGRFAEHHADDFLYDWSEIVRLTKEAEPGSSSIVLFGIRSHGVDSVAQLMDRMRSELAHSTLLGDGYFFVDHVYRKVLAVEVKVDVDEGVSVELKDITRYLYKMEKDDAQV